MKIGDYVGKVIIIGIDGMDSNLISKYEEDLPTIKKMMKDGSSLKLQTVFLPDSDTSWASIYTGMNPAEHGVLQFIDPLEKAHKYLSEEIDNTTIRGKAYWDVAGKYFNVPTYQLLGGKCRDKARVYYHVGGETTEDIIN